MPEDLFARICAFLTQVLRAKGVQRSVFRPEDRLYEDGLGLDSLDAATLAALLDNEFSSDPYNAGEFPETVGQIVEFYTADRAT